MSQFRRPGGLLSLPAVRLRNAGLRRTAARVALLDVLDAQGSPVTHAELVAHPKLGEVNAVTVYRTLASLEEKGLIHRIFGPDGVWRHCASGEVEGCPGNHAHFLCTDCDSVTCLRDQPLPRVRVAPGAVVTRRNLVATGTCPDCSRAAAAEVTPDLAGGPQ